MMMIIIEYLYNYALVPGLFYPCLSLISFTAQ
jgi:hypothetical protein